MRFPIKKSLLMAAAFLALSVGQADAAAPISLAESVSMALATHEDIAAAEAARDASRWDLSAARRATGFTARWSSTAVRIGGRDYEEYRRAYDKRGEWNLDDPWDAMIYKYFLHGSIPPDPYNYSFTNAVSLSYRFFSGGQLENTIEAQRQGLFAADLTEEDTRQSVRFKALQAYYDLLQQENLRNISKGAVDMASEQRDLIRVHFEEGAAAYGDLLQMEVQLADYHQSLVSAEGSLEAARYTLARVVGLPQDTPLEPTDTFTYTPYPKTLPECEAYALAHRPDGKAADCRVKQYEAVKNAQKSGWNPQIDAVANKSTRSNYSFSKDRRDQWDVGIEISWNVFDNGLTSARVNAAKEQENEARAEADNLWNDILLETRTAYAQMKAAEKNISDTARAVQKAEERLKMVTARYDEGMDILLNVTKAQEKLNEARSNHLTALYEYNLGKATLEKAIGVPVALDVPRYMEAVEEGKSANEALKEAAISMPVEDAQGNG